MLDTHADTDFLEDLWMGDCKCENYHRYTPVCSTVATYHVDGCQEAFVTCTRSVTDPGGIYDRMRRGDECEGRGKPASKCWTIRPI